MADPVVHARVAHADRLLALYSGDIPRACARLEEALEVFGARSNLSDQVWILLMLGVAYELQGDASRAIDCHEQVLDTTEGSLRISVSVVCAVGDGGGRIPAG